MYKPFVNDLKETPFACVSYTIKVPSGVHIDDLSNPSWWTHIRALLKPGDLVNVFALDQSLDVELRVLAVDVAGPKLRVLRAYADPVAMERLVEQREASAEERAQRPAFFAKWQGPTAKWCVIRAETLEVVVRELATREDAVAEVERLLAEQAMAVVA